MEENPCLSVVNNLTSEPKWMGERIFLQHIYTFLIWYPFPSVKIDFSVNTMFTAYNFRSLVFLFNEGTFLSSFFPFIYFCFSYMSLSIVDDELSTVLVCTKLWHTLSVIQKYIGSRIDIIPDLTMCYPTYANYKNEFPRNESLMPFRMADFNNNELHLPVYRLRQS